MKPRLTIGNLTIDCADAERACDFYASLTKSKRAAAFECPALKNDSGMMILFVQTDIPYVPPLWPEAPGGQQKQIHLDFAVDDLQPAVEEAIRLGAVKPASQYGGGAWVTLLDTEGHPFCLVKREEKTGAGLSLHVINFDCPTYEKPREFYAQLTGWRQPNPYVLEAENGLVVHFIGCDGDFDYIPPVWPEQPGKQQKQMRLNFQTDDIPSTVEEAVRLGAVRPGRQHGGEDRVTLLDITGHPFGLYQK